MRLPIGPFFAATSVLLAFLAVVFTGHGVAALQEAGVMPVTSLAFDPVPLLGIYPTREALGAQAVVLAPRRARFLRHPPQRGGHEGVRIVKLNSALVGLLALGLSGPAHADDTPAQGRAAIQSVYGCFLVDYSYVET